MKGLPEERSVLLAQYIIEHGATVRAAAVHFGISKSTVHKDVTCRLPSLNPALAVQTQAVLEKNKAERHIRGGLATREKYACMSALKVAPHCETESTLETN
ncbi:MAG: sporulation transcriptional regulator SpoIIID [Clostridia bacterium]|nr:sporulation transcriptional regulator SpoIIID [Clostridia bacterium]